MPSKPLLTVFSPNHAAFEFCAAAAVLVARHRIEHRHLQHVICVRLLLLPSKHTTCRAEKKAEKAAAKKAEKEKAAWESGGKKVGCDCNISCVSLLCARCQSWISFRAGIILVHHGHAQVYKRFCSTMHSA
jgi:hypothetical protein